VGRWSGGGWCGGGLVGCGWGGRTPRGGGWGVGPASYRGGCVAGAVGVAAWGVCVGGLGPEPPNLTTGGGLLVGVRWGLRWGVACRGSVLRRAPATGSWGWLGSGGGGFSRAVRSCTWGRLAGVWLCSADRGVCGVVAGVARAGGVIGGVGGGWCREGGTWGGGIGGRWGVGGWGVGAPTGGGVGVARAGVCGDGEGVGGGWGGGGRDWEGCGGSAVRIWVGS